MIHLDVYFTHSNGAQEKAGEIVATEPDSAKGGAITSEFRYESRFLSHGIALDPANLSPDNTIYQAARPAAGIHGVFEDSLPDAWGRRVLAAKWQLARARQRAVYLLPLLGDSAIGALGYAVHGESVQAIPHVTVAALHDLRKYAGRFEAGQPLDSDDNQLSLFFNAGSSPGGARPKTLVYDSDAAIAPGWIAKFPALNDKLDIPVLEYVTLTIAAESGLTVPEHKLINTEDGAVLLVRRFDQTEHGGRRHCISLQTLLNAENYYYHGYQDMADVVRMYSRQPANDLKNLYRQAVFNALIGNTDDHLKNFTLIHDTGWQLSPAYDLLPHPDVQTEHVLSYGPTTRPAYRDILQLRTQFSISRQAALRIIDTVLGACHGAVKQYREAGLHAYPAFKPIEDVMIQRLRAFKQEGA